MAYFNARNKRMTIYDAWEAQGVFAKNPANADSISENGEPLYQGPVPYPRMLYHPQGELRETNTGEIIVTPLGPKQVGQQFELIWRIVKTPEEEATLRAEGWHDHPAKAHAARTGEVIPASPSDRIAELEAQLAKLQLERNSEMAKALAPKAPLVLRKPTEPQADAD